MSFKRNFPVLLTASGLSARGRFHDPPTAVGRCQLLVPVPGPAVQAVRSAYRENSYVTINDGGECSVALVTFCEVGRIFGVTFGMTVGLRLVWDPSRVTSGQGARA